MQFDLGLWFSINSWKKTGRRTLTKSLALSLCLMFIFPYLSWAFTPAFNPLTGTSVVFKQKTVSLPASLGTVTQAYQGGDKLVIFIQDLHCNYEVQKDIAGLIDQAAENYGIDWVAVEGAALPISVRRLASVPFAWARQDIGEYLLKAGKITGPEFLAATKRTTLALEGIENAALYQSSLVKVQAFLNSESLGYVQDLREGLKLAQDAAFSPELMALENPKRAFHDGKLTLLQYALTLRQRAGELSSETFPNLVQYLALRREPVSDRVDADGLFSELDVLDQSLRRPLLLTPAQIQLAALEQRLNLLERLLNISASPEDLAEVEKETPALAVTALSEAIRQQPGTEEWALDPEAVSLDEGLGQARAFYRLADERSRVFVDNLCQRLDQRRSAGAVLVTGGFHAEKILADLRARRISYVCVKPRITRQDLANPYFDLLRNRRTPLEKLLEKSQTILAVASAFPQTADPAGPVDLGQQPAAVRLLDATITLLEKTAREIQAAEERPAAAQADGLRLVALQPGLSAALRQPGASWTPAEEDTGRVVPLTLKGWHVALLDPATLAALRPGLLAGSESRFSLVGLFQSGWKRIRVAGLTLAAWGRAAALAAAYLLGRSPAAAPAPTVRAQPAAGNAFNVQAFENLSLLGIVSLPVILLLAAPLPTWPALIVGVMYVLSLLLIPVAVAQAVRRALTYRGRSWGASRLIFRNAGDIRTIQTYLDNAVGKISYFIFNRKLGFGGALYVDPLAMEHLNWFYRGVVWLHEMMHAKLGLRVEFIAVPLTLCLPWSILSAGLLAWSFWSNPDSIFFFTGLLVYNLALIPGSMHLLANKIGVTPNAAGHAGLDTFRWLPLSRAQVDDFLVAAARAATGAQGERTLYWRHWLRGDNQSPAALVVPCPGRLEDILLIKANYREQGVTVGQLAELHRALGQTAKKTLLVVVADNGTDPAVWAKGSRPESSALDRRALAAAQARRRARLQEIALDLRLAMRDTHLSFHLLDTQVRSTVYNLTRLDDLSRIYAASLEALNHGQVTPTVVASEPHGHLGRFQKVVAWMKQNGYRRLVFLGDYFGKYADAVKPAAGAQEAVTGFAVMDEMQKLAAEGDLQINALMGRSEHLFLRAMLGDPRFADLWLNQLFEGRTVLRDVRALAGEAIAPATPERHARDILAARAFEARLQKTINPTARALSAAKLDAAWRTWFRFHPKLLDLAEFMVEHMHFVYYEDEYHNLFMVGGANPELDWRGLKGVGALVAMESEFKEKAKGGLRLTRLIQEIWAIMEQPAGPSEDGNLADRIAQALARIAEERGINQRLGREIIPNAILATAEKILSERLQTGVPATSAQMNDMFTQFLDSLRSISAPLPDVFKLVFEEGGKPTSPFADSEPGDLGESVETRQAQRTQLGINSLVNISNFTRGVQEMGQILVADRHGAGRYLVDTLDQAEPRYEPLLAARRSQEGTAQALRQKYLREVEGREMRPGETVSSWESVFTSKKAEVDNILKDYQVLLPAAANNWFSRNAGTLRYLLLAFWAQRQQARERPATKLTPTGALGWGLALLLVPSLVLIMLGRLAGFSTRDSLWSVWGVPQVPAVWMLGTAFLSWLARSLGKRAGPNEPCAFLKTAVEDRDTDFFEVKATRLRVNPQVKNALTRLPTWMQSLLLHGLGVVGHEALHLRGFDSEARAYGLAQALPAAVGAMLIGFGAAFAGLTAPWLVLPLALAAAFGAQALAGWRLNHPAQFLFTQRGQLFDRLRSRNLDLQMETLRDPGSVARHLQDFQQDLEAQGFSNHALADIDIPGDLNPALCVTAASERVNLDCFELTHGFLGRPAYLFAVYTAEGQLAGHGLFFLGDQPAEAKFRFAIHEGFRGQAFGSETLENMLTLLWQAKLFPQPFARLSYYYTAMDQHAQMYVADFAGIQKMLRVNGFDAGLHLDLPSLQTEWGNRIAAALRQTRRPVPPGARTQLDAHPAQTLDALLRAQGVLGHGLPLQRTQRFLATDFPNFIRFAQIMDDLLPDAQFVKSRVMAAEHAHIKLSIDKNIWRLVLMLEYLSLESKGEDLPVFLTKMTVINTLQELGLFRGQIKALAARWRQEEAQGRASEAPRPAAPAVGGVPADTGFVEAGDTQVRIRVRGKTREFVRANQPANISTSLALPGAPDQVKLFAYVIPLSPGVADNRLCGVMLEPGFQDQGLLRPLLNLFFREHPEVRSTNPAMENLIVLDFLTREYGFAAEDPRAEPNVWIKETEPVSPEAKSGKRLQVYFDNPALGAAFQRSAPADMQALYAYVNTRGENFRPLSLGQSLVVSDEKKFTQALAQVPVRAASGALPEKPATAEEAPADPRPVKAKLLHPAYVRYAQGLYQLVKKTSLPKNGIHLAGAFGADIARLMLSLNATEAVAVDHSYGMLKPDVLVKLNDPAYLRGGYLQDLDEDYARKYQGGFALWDALDTSNAVAGALAYELNAMGALNVKASRNTFDNLVLEFDWKHPDDNTIAHRTLTLMAGDITQPKQWPRELVAMLARRPLATYSHNAGSSLPYHYAHDVQGENYMEALYRHLGQNGLMLTDDYSVFGSGRYRVAQDYARDLDHLGMKELEVEGFAAIRDAILAVKRSTFNPGNTNPEIGVLLYYGWHQRVRQKTAAPLPGSQKITARAETEKAASAPNRAAFTRTDAVILIFGVSLLEIAYALPGLNLVVHRWLAKRGWAEAVAPPSRLPVRAALLAAAGLAVVAVVAPLGALSLLVSLPVVTLWANAGAKFFSAIHAGRTPAQQARLRVLGNVLAWALFAPVVIYLGAAGAALAWLPFVKIVLLGLGLNFSIHALNNSLALLGRSAWLQRVSPGLAGALRYLEIGAAAKVPEKKYFNLAAIRDSFLGVQAEFPGIQEKLTSQRDDFDATVIRNLLLAFRYMNDQLKAEKDLSYAMLLELNQIVHYGQDLRLRTEYAGAINKSREKSSQYIESLLKWYERHRNDSPWKRAAGVYIRILARPQLFDEGNHRTGAIAASFILMSAGCAPFVLTAHNAVAYFNLSTEIKFARTLSSHFKRVLKGDWKTERKELEKFLQAEVNPAFITTQYQQAPLPEELAPRSTALPRPGSLIFENGRWRVAGEKGEIKKPEPGSGKLRPVSAFIIGLALALPGAELFYQTMSGRPLASDGSVSFWLLLAPAAALVGSALLAWLTRALGRRAGPNVPSAFLNTALPDAAVSFFEVTAGLLRVNPRVKNALTWLPRPLQNLLLYGLGIVGHEAAHLRGNSSEFFAYGVMQVLPALAGAVIFGGTAAALLSAGWAVVLSVFGAGLFLGLTSWLAARGHVLPDVRTFSAYQHIAQTQPDRAEHIRRVIAFGDAFLAGDVDYFLSRLETRDEAVRSRYRLLLSRLMDQAAALPDEDRLALRWAMELHDLGYASGGVFEHEQRGVQTAEAILAQHHIVPALREKIKGIILGHTGIGDVVQGVLRPATFQGNQGTTPLLLLQIHNAMDVAGVIGGAAANFLDLAKLEEFALYAQRAEEIKNHFDAYRLEKLAKPKRGDPDLTPPQQAALQAMARQVFGAHEEEVRLALRERLDTPDRTDLIGHQLVARDPSYRLFAKFMSLLAWLAILQNKPNVDVITDLEGLIASRGRDEALSASAEKLIASLNTLPDTLNLETVRQYVEHSGWIALFSDTRPGWKQVQLNFRFLLAPPAARTGLSPETAGSLDAIFAAGREKYRANILQLADKLESELNDVQVTGAYAVKAPHFKGKQAYYLELGTRRRPISPVMNLVAVFSPTGAVEKIYLGKVAEFTRTPENALADMANPEEGRRHFFELDPALVPEHAERLRALCQHLTNAFLANRENLDRQVQGTQQLNPESAPQRRWQVMRQPGREDLNELLNTSQGAVLGHLLSLPEARSLFQDPAELALLQTNLRKPSAAFSDPLERTIFTLPSELKTTYTHEFAHHIYHAWEAVEQAVGLLKRQKREAEITAAQTDTLTKLEKLRAHLAVHQLPLLEMIGGLYYPLAAVTTWQKLKFEVQLYVSSLTGGLNTRLLTRPANEATAYIIEAFSLGQKSVNIPGTSAYFPLTQGDARLFMDVGLLPKEFDASYLPAQTESGAKVSEQIRKYGQKLVFTAKSADAQKREPDWRTFEKPARQALLNKRPLLESAPPGETKTTTMEETLERINQQSGGRYRAEITQRDGLTAYRFTDVGSGSVFEIVPGFANKITELTVAGQNILHMGPVSGSGGIEVMYPFMDRVRGSQFTFGGKTVSLEDPALLARYTKKDQAGTVYHGMARRLPWKVEETGFDDQGVFIRSSLHNADYPEILERFGPGSITLTYRLSGNELRCQIHLQNASIASTGSHPWIKRGDGEWYYRVPAAAETLMADLLPTGERRSVAGTNLDLRAFKAADKNRHAVLGDLVPNADGKIVSAMYNAKDGTFIEVEQSPSLPFVVIWDKEPGFFAIEPVSSPPGALNDPNNQHGLQPITAPDYLAEVVYRVRKMSDEQGLPKKPEEVFALPTAPRLPTNQPLLFQPAPVFQRFPGLLRGWHLLLALRVRLFAPRAGVLDAAALQNPELRTWALESYPALTADFRSLLKHPEQVQLGVLSRETLGWWPWLTGQISGYAVTEASGRITFYLPPALYAALLSPARNTAQSRGERAWARHWFQSLIHELGAQAVAAQLQARGYAPEVFTNELNPAGAQRGYASAAASSAETFAEFSRQEPGVANVTSPQILSLLLQHLPAAMIQASRQKLKNQLEAWLVKSPDVQTMLNALEVLDSRGDPLLGMAQALLIQAGKETGPARAVIVSGVLSNLIALLSGAPRAPLAVLTPAAAPVRVQVMGLPAAQTQALRALLQTALQAYAGAPQAAGSRQCLLALDAALQAAQGRGLGTLTLLPAVGEIPAAQLLSAALTQLPENETALVGNDFAQAVFALNRGVRPVSLQGNRVAQSVVWEVQTQAQNPAEVRSLAQAGRFGPNTVARLFTGRSPLPKLTGRAPAWSAGVLQSLAKVMPHSLAAWRLTLENLALQLQPRAVWQDMLAGLPAAVQAGWLGRELAALDLDSQEPLALAYRALVYRASPASRAEFAKVLLRTIRQRQAERLSQGGAGLAVENALDWVTFSEVFRGLGGMPLAEVARAESGDPAVAAWPQALAARPLVIPVALITAKHGRGALGYLTTSLEKGPFTVDTDIIRLFLRQGIQRFAGAA